MPLVATRGNAGAFGLGFTSFQDAPEVLGGMVLKTPTSVTYTGTNASIGVNGTITYSGCSSLSVNGVFGYPYKRYMLVFSSTDTSGVYTNFTTRLNGVDNALLNFDRQRLDISGTTLTSNRVYANSTFFEFNRHSSTLARHAVTMFLYGVTESSENVVARVVSANSQDSSTIYDRAYMFESGFVYGDGFTITPASGTISGSISVYGLVGA